MDCGDLVVDLRAVRQTLCFAAAVNVFFDSRLYVTSRKEGGSHVSLTPRRARFAIDGEFELNTSGTPGEWVGFCFGLSNGGS